MKNITLLSILLIVCLMSSGCFIKINKDSLNNVKEKSEYEWTIDSGKYWLTLDPVMWFKGPYADLDHSLFLFGNKVLYRNIDGRWVKWRSLERIFVFESSQMGSRYFCFIPIIWSEDDHLYVITCAGEYWDRIKLDNITKLIMYKISKTRKSIINKQQICCLKGSYTPPFIIHKILSNNDFVLIIPISQDDKYCIQMIYIKSKLSEKPTCHKVVSNIDLNKKPTIDEIGDQKLSIKWQDHEGRNQSQIININDLKGDECR